ncbi:Serine-threonine/tyrosine-protein kinase, catalytic domain [Sesbania bispinosa]|nr:Serine-threonine/tyrosine-protein kinase, catalytic domain [Sesbania bispinosa]
MSRQTTSSAFTKSKTLDNKYMLGDEIGKGAYGRVYKGLDLENGDFVAIKQVSLENIAQEDLNIIMQEIDLLKNLNHKNIVKYLGSLKTKSHLHIILEYVENGSLANIIKPNKFGPFPESLVAVYIAQVLEGLVYLHEQGVIHRDIKGANILTTKEGLVKLADFGVATKLTEADVNTHSVVGTPYWMAPEVIEMSGVCAASDIWSVGCTVIELLTCVPPYYDLQPMPALFRIVQDEHPPIPDSLSPDITDFLHQCFKKDARQRPDAKTLLSHPWIQNCRRALQSSLRHSGTLRNIEEDGSADAEVSGGEHKSIGASSSMEKEGSAKEFSTVAADSSKSHEDNASDSNAPNERTEKADDVPSDQVLTLAIREKSFLQTGSSKLSSNREMDSSEPTGNHEISNAKDLHEVMMNGEVGSPQSRGMASKVVGKDSSINNGNKSFAFGPRGQDNGSLKINNLGKLSLRHPHLHPLHIRLKANNGGNLLHRVMIGVLKDDVIDIDGLVFDEKLPGENLFLCRPLSSGKLGWFIKTRGSEDVQRKCSDEQVVEHMVKQQERLFQVFKLQQSTPRNDFCRIAAKNGILLRLINTLYSLNESTRLASMSVGGGILVDGSAQRPRSGILDPTHPFMNQNEAVDQQDLSKVRRGVLDHHSETSHASSSNPRRSDANYPMDVDRPQSSNAAAEVMSLEKSSNLASRESSAGALKERERIWIVGKLILLELMLNPDSSVSVFLLTGHQRIGLQNQQNLHRMVYQLQLYSKSKHESVLPLLHASEKKTNGELDFLMAEFADVSQRGKENGNLDSSARVSHKVTPKKLGTFGSSEGAASTSGIVSQTASGVLSGSGVLNARPGSATSSGLLSHMVSSLNAEVAREYLEKVADLLLEFAQADTTVKSYMCSQSLLSRLFQMFNRVEPPILLKILKCINYLSTDPNCLENLQRAEAIKYLIPNLELKEGSLVSEIHHEVLNALFNLCKINKRRQEQAAENGIIPHLMQFITSNSLLKQYALPLLCDMAHASRNSREQLRAHGGLDVYLNLLEDELWSVTALDSIAVCLAHDNDNRKVEQALLKKDAVQKLVKFFQCCPEQHFVHILEPFLKIITKSARINTTLAVNGLTPLLIARLDHQDAIARLNLLRLIKAVYEHHPHPKKLIVENDLPEKLQNLIGERRDGQVLVKQMATSLLKALHINTVL